MGDSLEHPGAWDCYTRLLPCLHCTPPPSESAAIIFLNRPPGHVDDYVGALPCLHCGGEKGKPCTYFETLCLCHMSSARSTSDGMLVTVSNVKVLGTVQSRTVTVRE